MKKLTLENKDELSPYIKQADYNEYNSNIITMLMWSSMYEVYFETFEHYAIAYTKMPNHPTIWMMPYCTKEYRKKAMQTIQVYSSTLGMEFEIHSMTLEFKNWLQENYPDEFLVWDCYNARDYIYERKQQETLVGKKMQKRRNHYNAFLKEYEGRFVYKALEECDIPNIYELLKAWKANKDHDDSIDAEEAGIRLLLTNLNTLEIQGGCIYIDGQLQAFNITSRLSKDTVQIHVEKANRSVRGLYIAILKLFLETLDEEVLYLNREDDMGHPELRKAKTDMQPISKTQKFGSCHQKIEISKANNTFLESIKALWTARFEDETKESTKYFFTHMYHEEECYILYSEEELIAMMQTRKMKILLDGKEEQVSFIVGVATNDEYEGCGYMKRLMNYVLEDLKKSERFTLLQAYDWDVYKAFGFEEVYALSKTKLDKASFTDKTGTLSPCTSPNLLLENYQIFTKDKNGYRVRDTKYYEQKIAYSALWNYVILLHEINGVMDGYSILEEQEDALYIHECIYQSETARDQMLSLLCEHDKKVFVMLEEDVELPGRKKAITHMMVKELGSETFPKKPLFINEEL
ncbi:MAG: GNAT family N-acetyltransferase [Longicatena sp.]